MTANKAPVIGIDLGTYNSAACLLLGGEPVLLRPEEGATEQGMCFPSVVEFDDNGEFVQTGELARRSLPVYPHSVVWGVKRLIGRSYDAAKSTGDIQRYAYLIEKDIDGGCMIRVGSKRYRPRDITALILQKIKCDAEAEFNPVGQSVTEAVITVPAYFDPVQKHETEQAALQAGFQKVYLLPEPTAAASAYRLNVDQENQYVVVVDIGAGTLDVTVALLYLDDNGQLQTVEKGHGGHTALGGLDMDDAVVQYATRRHGLKKMLNDAQAKARLRVELERAKIALSTDQVTRVAFGWQGGPVKIDLTRDELEAVVRPVVDRCRGPIRVALKEAGLESGEVSHVLLVGGPSMMPIVRRTIAEEFRDNEQIVRELQAIDVQGFPVHPMEVVARGAVLDVAGKIAPHGYGLLMAEHYYEMLSRRQRYPSQGSSGFTYWGPDRTIDFGLVRKAVNPEDYQEEYTLLGMFQFDCVPVDNALTFTIQWDYTENGILHFEVSQGGTGVSLPLFDVSRFEGHKIPRPAPWPHDDVPDDVPTTTKREPWSAAELEQAVEFGSRLLTRARERLDRAEGQQRERVLELCDRLEGWLQDETFDSNHRTPHIRDLGRALLSLMHVNGLMQPNEIAVLKQGL